MSLAHIRIVLVETSHPGNIGAVARAMKNMGLSALHLVQPKEFPHADATARASGADDVLEHAFVHDTLQQAVADCGVVIGTTARQRHIRFTPYEPRDCAAYAIAMAQQANQVAVVFGNERVGLQNGELALCTGLVTIPTSDSYSSLNIAMAVQIIAYELLLTARTAASRVTGAEPLATADELQYFYQHLQTLLEGTSFRDHTDSGHLMTRVRRIFNRAELDQNEMRILRGILSALQDKRSRFHSDNS
jgi:tRNA (cytidine32/uridine32-2'-O)-methyltransferase